MPSLDREQKEEYHGQRERGRHHPEKDANPAFRPDAFAHGQQENADCQQGNANEERQGQDACHTQGRAVLVFALHDPWPACRIRSSTLRVICCARMSGPRGDV